MTKLRTRLLALILALVMAFPAIAIADIEGGTPETGYDLNNSYPAQGYDPETYPQDNGDYETHPTYPTYPVYPPVADEDNEEYYPDYSGYGDYEKYPTDPEYEDKYADDEEHPEHPAYPETPVLDGENATPPTGDISVLPPAGITTLGGTVGTYVTFDPDGGTMSFGQTEPVAVGADGYLTAWPFDPMRQDFAFVRWLDENGDVFTHDMTVTASKTVTAEWGFAVSFNLGGFSATNNLGNYDPTNPQHLTAIRVVQQGVSINAMYGVTGIVFPATPLHTTNSFEGWVIYGGANHNQPFDGDFVVTGNMNVVATWDGLPIHTVTFEAGHPSFPAGTGTFPANADPVREAYSGLSIHMSSRIGQAHTPLNQNLQAHGYRFGAPAITPPAGFSLEGWWNAPPSEVSEWWTIGNSPNTSLRYAIPGANHPNDVNSPESNLPNISGRSNVPVNDDVTLYPNFVARIRFNQNVANGGLTTSTAPFRVREIPMYLIDKYGSVPLYEAIFIGTFSISSNTELARHGERVTFHRPASNVGNYSQHLSSNPDRFYGMPNAYDMTTVTPRFANFVGWTRFAGPIDPITNPLIPYDYPVTGNMTLFAQWASNFEETTVTFNLPDGAMWRTSWGGNTDPAFVSTESRVPLHLLGLTGAAAQLVLPVGGVGNAAYNGVMQPNEMPANPVKPGYIFVGWHYFVYDAVLNPSWSSNVRVEGFQEQRNSGYAGSIPQGGLEVTARFEPMFYVTLDPNGGIPISTVNGTISTNPWSPTLQWASPTHGHGAFNNGYHATNHNNLEISTARISPLDRLQVRERIRNLVGNGFTDVLVREGMVFVYWNEVRDGSGRRVNDSTRITSATTLYAQWLGNLTFNHNQSRFSAHQQDIIEVIPLLAGRTLQNNHLSPNFSGNTQVALPEAGLAHHSFIGWNTERDGTGTWFDETTIFEDTKTVYAQFIPLSGVGFHVGLGPAGSINGSYFYEIDNLALDGSENLSNLPVPTITAPSGYVFRGWFMSQAGVSPQWGENTGFYVPTMLFARWERHVMFNVAGNRGVNTHHSNGSAVILGGTLGGFFPHSNPAPASGWNFSHWSATEFGTAPFTATSTVTGDIYAVFYGIVNFNLAGGQNATGGTIIPAMNVFDADSPAGVQEPTRAGHTFNGWQVVGGGNALYDPADIEAMVMGAGVLADGNTTFVADWTRHEASFDIIHSPVWTAGNDDFVEYTGEEVAFSVGTRQYHRFGGWTFDHTDMVDSADAVTYFDIPVAWANNTAVVATANWEPGVFVEVRNANVDAPFSPFSGAVALYFDGDDYVLTAGTSPYGDTFAGWHIYQNATGVNAIVNATARNTVLEIGAGNVGGETIIIYGIWIPEGDVVVMNDPALSAGETITGQTANMLNVARSTNVTLEAGDRNGFRFDGWTFEVLSAGTFTIADATTATTSFIMPNIATGDQVVATANWIPYIPVEIVDGGAGYAVTGTPADMNADDEFIRGSEATVYAGDNDGYRFVNWTFNHGITVADDTLTTVSFDVPATLTRGDVVEATANWEALTFVFSVHHMINGNYATPHTANVYTGNAQVNSAFGADISFSRGNLAGHNFNAVGSVVRANNAAFTDTHVTVDFDTNTISFDATSLTANADDFDITVDIYVNWTPVAGGGGNSGGGGTGGGNNNGGGSNGGGDYGDNGGDEDTGGNPSMGGGNGGGTGTTTTPPQPSPEAPVADVPVVTPNTPSTPDAPTVPTVPQQTPPTTQPQPAPPMQSPIAPTVDMIKQPSKLDVEVGGLVTWTLHGFHNRSGEATTRFTITDTPGRGLNFVSGQTPAFSGGEGVTFEIRYTIYGSDAWHIHATGLDASQPHSFNFEQTGNIWYTNIELYFGNVPADFAIGNEIMLTFMAGDDAPDGVLVNR
ncbi:MAG: InlB B-repeat-containing protein, partial [Defluviitaleaceae bacterium]|nr:InlB B-repeat-containing protein [Defluviitaleaceae bacterium]